MTSARPPVDHRALMGKVEQIVEELGKSGEDTVTVHLAADRIISRLRGAQIGHEEPLGNQHVNQTGQQLVRWVAGWSNGAHRFNWRRLHIQHCTRDFFNRQVERIRLPAHPDLGGWTSSAEPVHA